MHMFGHYHLLAWEVEGRRLWATLLPLHLQPLLGLKNENIWLRRSSDDQEFSHGISLHVSWIFAGTRPTPWMELSMTLPSPAWYLALLLSWLSSSSLKVSLPASVIAIIHDSSVSAIAGGVTVSITQYEKRLKLNIIKQFQLNWPWSRTVLFLSTKLQIIKFKSKRFSSKNLIM